MNIMGQSLFRKNNILGNITNHPLKNNRNADDFLNSDAPSALTTTHLTVEMTLRKKTLKTEDENVLKQKITTSPCKAKSNGLRKKCLEKLQGSYEIMRLYCPKCIKDLPITDTVYVNHELQNCKICNSRITYGCNKCNKMFKSRRTVKEHMLLICGKSPNLQCAHCTYKTFWKKDLKNHLFKKHGFVRNMNVHPPRKYYDGKIQFHCPKCKIELTSEETAHRRDSDLKYCNKCGTNILLTCKQCNRVYKRINSIKTHLHYYCEKSPGFKCQKCNYQSYRSFNFERHMIQHNTESGV